MVDSHVCMHAIARFLKPIYTCFALHIHQVEVAEYFWMVQSAWQWQIQKLRKNLQFIAVFFDATISAYNPTTFIPCSAAFGANKVQCLGLDANKVQSLG